MSYYEKKLAAEHLKKAYDLAPPRTRQYLKAEIEFVLLYVNSSHTVLELGCGYGRVLKPLAARARLVVGIDSSLASLKAAVNYMAGMENTALYAMNAARLAFPDNTFDRVICIQNGISAFHVPPDLLVAESIRVTRPGGLALFASYSEKFWEHRLEWFRIQSEHGLVGELDPEKTKNGEIVGRDGFHATTFSADDFSALMSGLDVSYQIQEVDNSSLFCIITVA
jgi:2-polyprenyl-6-hydroxyphenyl methylase/3-demethylubiquinone-9 3-methyltransferase